MPPKAKKTKAEEALDFLSNLDNLDASPPTENAASNPPPPTGPTPRASNESAHRTDLSSSAELVSPPEQDEEATKALAFLEAQIAQKRSPLTAPKPPTPVPTQTVTTPLENVPSPPVSGWGSSFWSSAATAIQSAQKMADEGYKRVRTEGVSGVTEQLGGVDLNKLRKGAEGFVKGVDLEKLRQDLMTTTTSTLSTILNTVAPPISAHETLELWLSHPMVGYAGVEGVVYRAWTRILEQTESGELIVVWSPPDAQAEKEGEARNIHPVQGWDAGWEAAQREIEGVKAREEKDPQGRARPNPNLPVTTLPIFLHLQPLLAPLAIPEPPILTAATASTSSAKHLYFLMSLHDPAHSLRFTTASQPCPADWLEVEYERSDWVEERLVEVLRTGVEILAQDYVATRMGLKSLAGLTRPQSPVGEKVDPAPAEVPARERELAA